MRLMKLELKRVLKTRLSLILLTFSLVLSLVMAYIPTTFSYVTYRDTNGDTVKFLGLDAVQYLKTLQSDTTGEVTPQKVRQAVEAYQTCLTKYGVENTYDLPEGVYEAEILPYAPLLHGVREAFADPDSGIAPSLMDIDPEKIEDFYGACEARLDSLMKLEQRDHPRAQEAAKRLYSRVETPYQLYPGYNTDAMDYQLLLSFLIVLFCTVIAAPIFTSDYQTGADDIYRCTKYGRVKFAITKLLSALLICGTAFSLCAVVFLLVSNSLYGWECTKTSIQMLYSIVNLPNLNLGQLQWVCAGAYCLCLLATLSFTLFPSSRLRNVVASLAVALVCCILPVIVYMALPSEIGQWIYTILPAGGVAMQTSFLYALVDFAFWNVGNTAIWTPYVMLGAYFVEIPLFLCLAVCSYCTHKAK